MKTKCENGPKYTKELWIKQESGMKTEVEAFSQNHI